MVLHCAQPVSMLRYVLAFAATKVAVAGALLIYVLNVDGDAPVSPMVITIIAISLPIAWFAKAVNRPMRSIERGRFAIGNTVAELIFTVALGLTTTWLTGASFDWEGVSHVLGGKGDPQDAKIAFLFGITFGLLPVPLLSALFGWFWTKDLPKTSVVEG